MDCPLINVNALSGLVNLANIGWFFAIGVGAICAIIIAFQVWKYIPSLLWEVLLYGASIAAIAAPYWIDPALVKTINAAEIVGCILFAGSLMLTGHIHNLERNTTGFFTTLLVVYAGLALFYQNESIGFLAVMALIGLCGFGVWTSTLVVFMGYEDDDKIPLGTLVSGLLTVAVLNTAHLNLGYAEVFKQGAVWVGSIVACIGLLIMSTRWYGYGNDNRRPNYVFMQLVTIGAYASGIIFGAITGLDPIMYVSAVFAVIYLSMKPHEIEDAGLLTHAFFGLVAAIAIGFGANWLTNNMADVQTYLTSVRG